jgi:hypothetical protein
MSAVDWQKSSYSQQGANCVFVAAPTSHTVLLRESDDPRQAILATTPAALRGLIAAAKHGALTGQPTS